MQYLDKTGLARLWNNIKSKLSNKEDKSNKVTSITSSSTDIQYPSAKAVYNALQNSSGSSAVLINSTESETSIVNKLYSLINDDYSYKQPGIFVEDEHTSSEAICTIFYFAAVQKIDDSTDMFGFLGNAGFKMFTADKNTHTFTAMNVYYSDLFESVGNKVTTISSSSSDNEYPSAKAVKDYVDKKQTYSTDEIVVGTWIDGKPIYRKVYQISALPNSTRMYVTCGIRNVENLITMRGVMKSSNEWDNLPGVYTNGTLIDSLVIERKGDILTQMRILTNTNRSTFSAFVILEYTKTTD